jgi:hypothetical protein
MAGINTKIDRIAARFLNDVNDSAVGGLAISVIGSAPVLGQLGDILYLTAANAAVLSDSAIGTLYEGYYQYVRFLSTSSASNARGQVVLWSDYENYVVTPDVTAALTGKIAGITLNTVTKGNYGWIQISGKATCLCKASVTDTTAGDIAIVSQTPTNDVDGIADATAFATALLMKSLLGVFIEAPANGALKLVQLRFVGLPY